MPETPLRRLTMIAVKIVAWGWLLFAGGGGFGLLILQGPWPPTNGWFAMFSGIAACPLWPAFLRKHARVTLPGWAQLAIVILLVIAGRVALVVERHLGMRLPPPR